MKVDNVSGTMIFTKVNNLWKATFYQESSGQPIAYETVITMSFKQLKYLTKSRAYGGFFAISLFKFEIDSSS